MSQIITVEEAVAKFKDGMTVMVGGFLANGSANRVLDALAKSGVKDLTVICNDSAYPDKGIGQLIVNKQLRKLIVSYIGACPQTAEQMNAGELEVEFSPQGTLAERVRAGGFGLGGVLTPTGLGTVVAEGKQVLSINGKDYLLEMPLRADKKGNLRFRGTSSNFNPMMATAADMVICEPKEIVEIGEIDPDDVHTPGILIDYLVK